MSTPEPPSQPSSQPAPQRPGLLRLGSIGGIGIYVTSTWFLVAALLAFLVAPRVEAVEPGLGAWRYVAGLAFAVVIYLSVLLHELAHALVAARLGYSVSSITLNFLGGMTAIDSESRRPRHEFWIAVVGPLTSIGVGLAALALWFVTPDGLLRLVVEGLIGANLLVGAINLVPGLPLDGGRVLRAAVWGLTGSLDRGTVAAGWGGRITAVAVLAWPLVLPAVFDVRATILDFVMAFIIAAFLWSGATASLQHARLRRTFPALVARDLARRTLAVPEDLPLSEAVRRAQEAEAGAIVTVTGAGRPVGIVSEAAVHATPAERRPWVATSTVARSAEQAICLPVGIDGESLVRAIAGHPAPEYLLLEPDGRVFGVLSTGDVDRAFRALGG